LIAKGPPTGDAARRVVISGGDVLQLRAGFMRTWQREPTAEELRGALEQHIRQEVLYREALARGYDRDDQVVRRAMQQKMEFLAASQALQEPPTDEEIEAFFSLRQDRYELPAVVTFAQVYVSLDQRGSDAEVDAKELLERLRGDDPAQAELAEWGDPIMLEPYYSDRSEQDVSSAFGGDFAQALLALPVGSWEGPVISGYGLHLVKIFRRVEPRVPEWREVKGRVVSDMEFEAKASSRDQLYQEIAQTYEIVFDSQVRDLLSASE
ncbi:MAG: peptidylprolyl isomerase, partial [Thermoanaerobaculales bacterium]|nr:peptidylprolyl isomerase [Thermoanaerobaculales bacterium]